MFKPAWRFRWFTGQNWLKVRLSSSKKNYLICFNESVLKMMKNALKALFVFKIFRFFPWLFSYVDKTT